LAEAPAPGQRPGAPKQNMSGQLMIMLVMFFAISILFTPELRTILGNAVGFVFYPAVGFGGLFPIITLMLAGLLMIFISTILRHFFVDWVSQARNQKIVSAFQKELRKARLENNMYKTKKLTEVQGEIMAKSMSGMNSQMKLMPVTMAVIIPVFAWLYIFVSFDVPTTMISVPWYWNTDLNASSVLPNWILLYSLVTLPFGQVLARVLKYFSFRKRLLEIEGGKGAVYEGDH
jgi:uncharacterized membrane protein (DUF106 family)